MELDTFLPGCVVQAQSWDVQSVPSESLFLTGGNSAVSAPKLLKLTYEFALLHVPKTILLLINGERYRIMQLVRLFRLSVRESLAGPLSLTIYPISDWDFHPQFGGSSMNTCKISLFVFTGHLRFPPDSRALLISAAVKEYNCSVYHTVVNSGDNNHMIVHRV